jgi:non-ribosomal peptide synthase protein (TIGR01720 family)
VPEIYRSRIDEALLAAFARAATGWTGGRAILVDREGHGRGDAASDLDLSRTVGWFTAIHPLLLDPGPGRDPGEALRRVKERIRAVPGDGAGFGTLRYLHPDPSVAEGLHSLPRAQVLFNYWGQVDRGLAGGARLRPSDVPLGRMIDPQAPRSHLLEVNCSVAEGRLRAVWTYSRARHRRSTVEGWARSWIDELRALVEACRARETTAFSPSDFSLVDLEQEQLDRLIGKLDRTG